MMETTIESPALVTQEVLLHLLKKELQGRKFNRQLSKVGFDPAFFNTDLGIVILTLMGHPHPSDTLWKWYDQHLDHFTSEVDLHHHASASQAAFNFYLAFTKKLLALRPTIPTPH